MKNTIKISSLVFVLIALTSFCHSQTTQPQQILGDVYTWTDAGSTVFYSNWNTNVGLGLSLVWGGGIPNAQTTGGVEGIGAYANVVINGIGLNKLTTGEFNYCVGSGCDASITTGYANDCLGDACNSGITTGTGNTCVGDACIQAATTATSNWAGGASALEYLTTGSYNDATGAASLSSLTTGSYNTADGNNACANLTTAVADTCMGANAAAPAEGQANIVIGYTAAATNSNQTFIGVPGSTAQTTLLGIQSRQIGASIASAPTIAPVTPVVHITGSQTISTITPPQGCTDVGYACTISLIPDGLWKTEPGGNIAWRSTAIVGRVLTVTYDPGTSKWYPSY
jgi:hypothetical protein